MNVIRKTWTFQNIVSTTDLTLYAKMGFYKLHAILIEINYRCILLSCILVAITTVQVEMCKSLLYVENFEWKNSIFKILTLILNVFKLNSICEANYWFYSIIDPWRIAFGLGWRNPWRFLLTALLIFGSRASFGASYLQIFIISTGFLVRIEPEFDYLEGSSVAMNYKLIFA